jgi:succinate dehydrogenase / fumarate reductase membrane anchor subunit
MRTPLGRAIGLGSAKEGVQHWWAQRLTALALVPLMLWFAASLIAHLGAGRMAVLHWLGAPLPAIAMVLVLIAGLYHMSLGVQVVIEDYIQHEGVKLAAIVLDRFVAFVLAIAGIFAVLRIALGG